MNSFDDVWNEIYSSGHRNYYPWDTVVSFIFRYAPQNKLRHEVNILELGCGAGNNLWFCAKEGFSVVGVDASPVALNYARDRFINEKLNGKFLLADFKQIDLVDNSFDLIFDRAALSCTPYSSISKTISEVLRLLKPGGKFLFIPYADTHSSATTGVFHDKEKLVTGITAGSLVKVGQIAFLSLNDIKSLFDPKFWRFIKLERCENTDMLVHGNAIHAEYRVIVEKL